jgi:hypothetical protein
VKTSSRRQRARVLLLPLLVLAGGTPAAAQVLPSEPLVFGAGRVTLSGDVSATYGCAQVPQQSGATASWCGDDTGFFNYTDYDRSTLRMLRIDLNTAVRATRQLSILSDIRTENGAGIRAYGLYLRFHPWEKRGIDIQAGRIPPTFGAFPRRSYATDNLLIGYPLAYQYLTSLRADALPRNADDLLRMRGRGWLASYPIGDPNPANGMPVVSAFAWDTGVQLHAASTKIEATAALTAGSLGRPLFADDNAGKQIAVRVAARPVAGLIVGASAARSPYVARSALDATPPADRTGSFTQSALGADVEYSRGYYLLRFETILSGWTLPIVGSPDIRLPLRATSTLIEGRYKLRPGLYVAARADRLGFSDVTGDGGRTATWDAPISRLEAGLGYSIRRNVQLKGSVQYDDRDGGRVHRATIVAGQLLYWF